MATRREAEPADATEVLRDLERHAGFALLDLSLALLKGVLEGERDDVVIAAGDDDAWAAIVRLVDGRGGAGGSIGPAGDLLARHGVRVVRASAGVRAVDVARRTAAGGGTAIAFVAASDRAAAESALVRAAADRLPAGAALLAVIEDAPLATDATARLDLGGPHLVAASIADARRLAEPGLLLSAASRRPAVLSIDASLVGALETVPVGPNRRSGSVDAMIARRQERRRSGLSDAGDPLRLLRRLELVRLRATPSPGERVPCGFVTVGPATTALGHLVQEFRLVGRLPVLELPVIAPLDEAPLARLLERCDQVVVLEPRPGEAAELVRRAAERLRRTGGRPGSVWAEEVPPDPGGGRAEPVPIVAGDALHPSRLVRRIRHLLHESRPTAQVAARLEPDPRDAPAEDDGGGAAAASRAVPPRVGAAAAMRVIREHGVRLDQWVRDRTRERPDEDDEDAAAIALPSRAVVDGSLPAPGDDVAMIETWDRDRFAAEGAAAVRHAARAGGIWILAVADVCEGDAPDPARIARAVVPAERADRVRVAEADLGDVVETTEAFRDAVLEGGVTVLVLRDAPVPRLDVARVERALVEIDRLGFEPSQQASWSIDRSCAVRSALEEDERRPRLIAGADELSTDLELDRLVGQPLRRFRVRVRPLREQVRVVRSRPPIERRSGTLPRIDRPVLQHARRSAWRCHVAGLRTGGGSLRAAGGGGVATAVLARAGRALGYHVVVRTDRTPIGPGRRAWAQLLFTRAADTGGPAPAAPPPSGCAVVPYGEADLVLGFDAGQTIAALDERGPLRVGSVGRTWCVATRGGFLDEGESGAGGASERRAVLETAIARSCDDRSPPLRDVQDACRTWFHTERVADLVLLGMAWQHGLVPVPLETMEAAVADVEHAGFGRCIEAFRFGRSAAGDPALLGPPALEEEDPARMVRRVELLLQPTRPGRRAAQRLRAAVAAMPGLAETRHGRVAVRDLAVAVLRGFRWGRDAWVKRYLGLLRELYEADRPASGRRLARSAVLPLATAMLIRDPFFVGAVVTSPEHLGRTRRLLNARRARQDEIERRFLTRLEIIALGHRLRADVRTSDWPARLGARMVPLVPTAIRGTQRERRLRSFVVELVEQVVEDLRRTDDEATYDRWAESFHRLHEAAAEARLRVMAMSEIRMLASPPREARSEPAEDRADG